MKAVSAIKLGHEDLLVEKDGAYLETLKPIFHLEQHLRWVPNAKKKWITNIKSTRPTQEPTYFRPPALQSPCTVLVLPTLGGSSSLSTQVGP